MIIFNSKSNFIFIMSFIIISLASGQTTPDHPSKFDYERFQREWFSIGIAASYTYFNSGATYYDKTVDRRIYISPEGQFDLDRSQFIPKVYGFLHPAKRHWIGFSYFTIKREGGSGQVDRDLGDYEVNGDIYMADRSSFYYLSYNYALFYDNRSYIMGALGLYGIHIRTEVEAEGEIRVNDELIEDKIYKKNLDRFAPFPLLGLQSGFLLTPRWFVAASASIIGGAYRELSAFVFESKMGARFIINKHFGITGTLMFFNAYMEADEEKQKTNVDYGFTAIFLGIDMGL